MKDPSGPVRELLEVAGLANVIAIEENRTRDPGRGEGQRDHHA